VNFDLEKEDTIQHQTTTSNMPDYSLGKYRVDALNLAQRRKAKMVRGLYAYARQNTME
jgi:hypothetical protein